MKTKDKPGLFASANSDSLWGRILKAVLRNLHNVVFEIEVWHLQQAALGELRLNCAIEKNLRAVLAGNDEEPARVMAGLRGRLIIGAGFSGCGIR